MRPRRILPTLALLLAPAVATAIEVPTPPREFRGVWVATVGNIDWPSKPGLATEAQQDEAIAILDRCVALKLNAVVFQVRTSCDALYDSKLEPWSAFLTGEQGKRPDPYYDPLAFWVDEAHRRGLQLHAWFNPYRARYAAAKYEESADHVSKARPGLVKPYGGMLWLDPGEPEAQEHSLKVFLDVVERYDVDGIHIDDYFYPYPVVSPDDRKEVDFPDGPSWARYRESGGTLARDDWRRDHINTLIRKVYEGTKARKRHVQFGISPFGIPRPGRAEGVKGFDQYAKLYADAEHWLREGWCDYWTPQLYWKIDAPEQRYKTLLDYWVGANAKGRHVWPGLIPSRVGDGPKGFAPEEIIGQVEITRKTPGASGVVHFSMKALMTDRNGVAPLLRSGPYREPALVPTSPWLDDQPPARPTVAIVEKDGKPRLSIRPGAGETPTLWAVYTFPKDRQGRSGAFAVHPAARGDVPLDGETAAVAAVDRLGNLSEWAAVGAGR